MAPGISIHKSPPKPSDGDDAVVRGHEFAPDTSPPSCQDKQAAGLAERPTKVVLLAAMVGDSRNHELIGAAWPLYLCMVLGDGSITGTYDTIGERMGQTGRSIRNWVGALERNGVARKKVIGRGIEVMLLEPHMSIAMAPDRRTESAPAASVPDDPRAAAMLQVLDGAKRVDAKVEVKVVI